MAKEIEFTMCPIYLNPFHRGGRNIQEIPSPNPSHQGRGIKLLNKKFGLKFLVPYDRTLNHLRNIEYQMTEVDNIGRMVSLARNPDLSIIRLGREKKRLKPLTNKSLLPEIVDKILSIERDET